MLICFRISNLGYGGAERVFISIARYLQSVHGFNVHFVVDQSIQGGTEDVARKHGFKVFSLGVGRTLRSIFPLRTYIDSYRPDVIISAYTDTNFGALISCQLARHRCLTVVSEHASLDEHWQHASRKRKFMLNAYVKYGYRLADHVLAVSQGIAKQVISRMEKPHSVSYIHNPIRFNGTARITDQPLAEKKSTRTILAVGRIARQKDYLCLLQALQIVSQTLECRLVIVGGIHEQDEKERLDRYIADNQLSTAVEFVGFTDQVESYYLNADVFVLSSAWEGFGNVLVEALAFGLPVVSTDCNHGPAEILADGKFGTLVPVGNHRALANGIQAALSSPADVLKLQLRAADFSEECIGSRYHTLIQQLVPDK